ncbi:MAG: FAD/NAD(P)-binding protein [Verrucomicrobiota bacterium]
MPDNILPSAATDSPHGLGWLVTQLEAHDSVIDEATARRLLTLANLNGSEVGRYVTPRSESYGRRAVVRRENYELLVLTWMPGQQSVAHDHSGSLCGLKVVQGSLTEQLYQSGPDGQVRPAAASRLAAGDIAVDPGVIIHSLANPAASGQMLVTVHLYSPPLPEVRRYAVAAKPPAPVFLRVAPPEAPAIVIIGGGFTGTMTLANLLRETQKSAAPLRIMLIDRQPALGEGIAYRTNDVRHLLNVPAGKMSAWPDRPDDFLDFARAFDSSIKPGDFLPRMLYGHYVRQILLEVAQSSDSRVSVELIRDEATKLTPAGPSSGWQVETAAGRCVRAGLAIITLGHRPPAEQFIRRWKGPRTRFVADPWAALVLTQIGPDEPVLVLGSGLTAVDALLTLDGGDRTAPLTVVSRRGLLPQAHARDPRPADDVSSLVAGWLDPAQPLKVRELVCSLRKRIRLAVVQGVDWRQVIDGLRPATAKIWARLSPAERGRFLRHVRPFWEVHRHRMPPTAADQLEQLRARKILDPISGALVTAEADNEGINVTLSGRGNSGMRHLRVAWVINCTGPGIHHRRSTHPILRPLIESGGLCDDPFGLGLLTDSEGRAVDASGEAHADLLVAGTLRKSGLWESTAVPELRQQAAAVARTALQRLAGNGSR